MRKAQNYLSRLANNQNLSPLIIERTQKKCSHEDHQTPQLTDAITVGEQQLDGDQKRATRIDWIKDGAEGGVDLSDDNIALVTIGSLTENSGEGDQHTPATVTTLDDKIPPYIQRIATRDPFSGRVVTGGIVTARDSN